MLFLLPIEGFDVPRCIHIAEVLVLLAILITILRKLSNLEEETIFTKSILTISSLLILFLTLEFCFLFIPQSHGVGDTLGNKVWNDFYWSTNSLNYRDKEIDADGTLDVFFIGDSFTAGSGIKNTENRFTNIFEQQVGQYESKVRAYNLAYEGIDTRGEFSYCLNTFEDRTGVSPELVVLQYFGNDIEMAALEKAEAPFDLDFYKDIKWPFNSVLSNSYLVNYLYFYKVHNLNQSYNAYFNFIKEAYAQEDILNTHFQDLDKIIDYCESKSIPLVVIIIPFVNLIEESNEIYGIKVEGYLDKRGVVSINLCEDTYLINLKLEEIVVNDYDYHLSELGHKHIAFRLDTLFSESYEFW